MSEGFVSEHACRHRREDDGIFAFFAGFCVLYEVVRVSHSLFDVGFKAFDLVEIGFCELIYRLHEVAGCGKHSDRQNAAHLIIVFDVCALRGIELVAAVAVLIADLRHREELALDVEQNAFAKIFFVIRRNVSYVAIFEFILGCNVDLITFYDGMICDIVARRCLRVQVVEFRLNLVDVGRRGVEPYLTVVYADESAFFVAYSARVQRAVFVKDCRCESVLDTHVRIKFRIEFIHNRSLLN